MSRPEFIELEVDVSMIDCHPAGIEGGRIEMRSINGTATSVKPAFVLTLLVYFEMPVAMFMAEVVEWGDLADIWEPGSSVRIDADVVQQMEIPA